MNARTLLATATLGFAAFCGMATLLGRPAPAPFPRPAPDAGDFAELANLRKELARSETRWKEKTLALRRELAVALGRLNENARRAAAAGTPATAPAAIAAVPVADIVPMDVLLANLDALLQLGDAADPDALEKAQDRLHAAISSDSRVLAQALEKFRRAAGTELGARLAVPLGMTKNPATEAVAVDLVRRGNSAQRLAGLDLLDRLEIDNDATRGAVLDVLRSGDSPEVLSGALYALHHGVTDPAQMREAAAALAPLVAHTDPEVRRRAVIASAEWAADAASLEPTVRALADPSPDVRAGAAFALGRTRATSPAAVAALARTVADEGEDWGVRELAWKSLAQFPLDEGGFRAYEAFQRQHEALAESAGEGVGNE